MWLSIIITIIIGGIQAFYFYQNKKERIAYNNFFKKKDKEFSITSFDNKTNSFVIEEIKDNKELNGLIKDINKYVVKTKGTIDFMVMQNKVERLLEDKYDNATAKLSFPTQIGLLGTFIGVLIGISMFVIDMSNIGEITNESIQKLLSGVIVSMFTSFCGLLLTIINTHAFARAKKEIDREKLDFFDFLQTELIPALGNSLTSSIALLHKTLDKFEPTFNKIIKNFESTFSVVTKEFGNTFQNCTSAFGEDFEHSVKAITTAVDVMGKNMEHINDNIDMQSQLLDTIKSDKVILGLEKYVAAVDKFSEITQSLNMFEEARRIMLAAVHETIEMQEDYKDSIFACKEIAISMNQILNRIKTFEDSINELGERLSQRDMLGNEVINKIRAQVAAIEKKQSIVDTYVDTSDEILKQYYEQQAIQLQSYKDALDRQHSDFINMLIEQGDDLKTYVKKIQDIIDNFVIDNKLKEDIQKLNKLQNIEDLIRNLKIVSPQAVKEVLQKLDNILDIQNQLNAIIDNGDDLNFEVKKKLSLVEAQIKDIFNKIPTIDNQTEFRLCIQNLEDIKLHLNNLNQITYSLNSKIENIDNNVKKRK